jgi:hypothetical protein
VALVRKYGYRILVVKQKERQTCKT